METITFQDLVIDLNNHSVEQDHVKIEMPKLSFELLAFLITSEKTVNSVEDIASAVWEGKVVSNDTVLQRITLLRKALGDDPKQPKYIESVRGRGYKLVLERVGQTPNVKRKTLVWVAFALIMLVPIGFWLINQSTSNNESISKQDTSLDRANYYLKIGQKNNVLLAIELFRKSIAESPTDIDAMLGLSTALSRAVCRYEQPDKYAQEAILLAENILLKDSANANAEYAAAYAWDCLGRLEKALEHYLRAVKLDNQKANAMSSAAHLLTVKSELITAYELNIKAKQLNPGYVVTDVQILNILSLLGFDNVVEEKLKTLFEHYPDNVLINEAYPKYLFSQGLYEQSKSIYKKVIDRGNSRASLLLYYAELKWLTESKEAAQPWVKMAAEISPAWDFSSLFQKIINKTITREEAQRGIKRREDNFTQGNIWPHNFIDASLLSLYGLQDKKLAIEYLNKAISLGYLDSEYLMISLLFGPLREMSEFHQIINKINMKRSRLKKEFLELYSTPESYQQLIQHRG